MGRADAAWRGGARVNAWGTSWPFARLSVEGDGLRLSVMGRQYLLEADRIERLVRSRQLSPTTGIRLVHTDKDLPETLIFFPVRYKAVCSSLRSFGFEVGEQ